MEDCERAGQHGMDDKDYDKAMSVLSNNVQSSDDLSSHITEVVRKYNLLKHQIEGNKATIEKLTEDNKQLERQKAQIEKPVLEWKRVFEMAETVPETDVSERHKWNNPKYDAIRPLFKKVKSGLLTPTEFKEAYEKEFEHLFGKLGNSNFYNIMKKIKQGKYRVD